jgi:pyruvate dehydrogenase E2 component (dihydrolipoamide acetyltransferase)
MALEILMPALSPTMKEGNLATWIKKEGDKVSSGDVIAEIETDKATMEVEATDDGILAKILIPDGTNGVQVNTLIAVLLEAGDDAAAVNEIISNYNGSSHASNSKTQESKEEQIRDNPNISINSPETQQNKEFASPLAKRIAEQRGINISGVSGSGPNGRIIKQDIENIQSRPVNVQSFVRNEQDSTMIPHSNMRKIIAKRLVESKQNVPHFYVTVEASITQLNKARKEINVYLSQFEEKVSVNDIIIKACANALRIHPKVNASWSEDGMIMYNNVDISIAVGIDDGLITPIVKNADTKSLRTIAVEAKDLIKRARLNKLSLEEFQGGGFSLSNLGMYNVAQFGAIINPPQSAILAVGGVKSIAKFNNGQPYEDHIISLTISCDHRVVDGVLAAEFLNTIKMFVENPNLLIV